MSAVETVSSKISEALESGGNRMSTKMNAMLGKSTKPVRVASGVVSKIGLSFFKGKKPQTVWSSHITPAGSLAGALIAQDITSFEPAYMAQIELEGTKHDVQLSSYYTRQFHGSAPEVNEGDVVDVYVAPNRSGGYALTYTPAKVVK